MREGHHWSNYHWRDRDTAEEVGTSARMEKSHAGRLHNIGSAGNIYIISEEAKSASWMPKRFMNIVQSLREAVEQARGDKGQ